MEVKAEKDRVSLIEKDRMKVIEINAMLENDKKMLEERLIELDR